MNRNYCGKPWRNEFGDECVCYDFPEHSPPCSNGVHKPSKPFTAGNRIYTIEQLIQPNSQALVSVTTTARCVVQNFVVMDESEPYFVLNDFFAGPHWLLRQTAFLPAVYFIRGSNFAPPFRKVDLPSMAEFSVSVFNHTSEPRMFKAELHCIEDEDNAPV